jgi:hypothetical protein
VVVGDLEDWRRRAQAAEDRFELVVEHVRDAVLIFDEGGLIAFANTAARRHLDLKIDPEGDSPITLAVVPGALQAVRLGVIPTVWDGRPASMVILSDPPLSVPPGQAAGSNRDWPAEGETREPRPAAAGESTQGATVIRCVLAELPALAVAFGTDLAEDLVSTVSDRLRAFVGTSGSVTRVEESPTLLVVLPIVDQAEAQRLALDVQAIAQDPVAIDGILIRLHAVVSADLGARLEGPGIDSGTRGADKRGRIRGVLFSGPGPDN